MWHVLAAPSNSYCSFCKGEGMKCYPRSSFSDFSRWHFPNKRTKWAQGAYSVILQHSCTFFWEKKCEKVALLQYKTSLNTCIEFLVMLSPPPRAVGAAGTAWYESLKEGPVFAHYDVHSCTWWNSLPVSLYCSFPFFVNIWNLLWIQKAALYSDNLAIFCSKCYFCELQLK